MAGSIRQNTWLLAGAGAYLGLRLASFVRIAGHASSFPDSAEYRNVERLSPFSLDFWTWYKPWGTPLLWKLLPGSASTSAPIGQWIVSIAAWLFLAAVVYATFERAWAKYAGCGLVLAFSLVPAVAVWDGALLSESLTLSLGAILVGTLLLLAKRPTAWTAAAVLVVAFLLAGTRSTNGYVVPFLVIPLVVLFARNRPRLAVAVSVGALAVAGYCYVSSNVRQWQVPLGEIIALRVLDNPSELRYFTDRGMPVSGSLAQDILANRTPLAGFEKAPSLAFFMPWFNAKATSVYRDYLLSHPSASLLDPIRDLPSMVSPSSSTHDLQALPVHFYAAGGYRDALPSWLASAFYPSSWQFLLAWAAMVLSLLGALAFLGVGRRIWIVPVVLLLSAVPHAMIVWDGDSASIGRHALLLAVYVRLGLILATLYAAEAAWLYLLHPAIQTKVSRLVVSRAHRSVSTIKPIVFLARTRTR